MNLKIKCERALEKMPWEIIVQYSSATDNVNTLVSNALKEAKEENKTFLEVLLDYATETLETYDNILLGHVNYFMQFEEDEIDTWKKERKEIKKYIKLLEKYLNS